MPWGLKRYQQARDLHFVTFSCYRREPLLDLPEAKELFLQALERVRWGYRFYVVGYVVMPEHVHLLVSDPQRSSLAAALQALKQSVARRLVEDPHPSKIGSDGTPASCFHFWMTRYYDFKRVE